MNSTNIKRIALPIPPLPEIEVPDLQTLVQRRNELITELEHLDVIITASSYQSICGDRNDLQDVELYNGSLGVTIDFVAKFEKSVGQLQWLDDLPSRFQNPGDNPGTVSGKRWGSGGLISDDIFITAGHCFNKSGGGWIRPSRTGGKTLEPKELALLMKVNFGYQIDRESKNLKLGDSYPVLELLEIKEGGVDYALIRIGTGIDGELPGQKYGTLALASNNPVEGMMLCLIQHPSGGPKQVEAGPLVNAEGGILYYDGLDTISASSGSPLLDPNGEVVGIHTMGGCSAFSGSNSGISIDIIKKVSSML